MAIVGGVLAILAMLVMFGAQKRVQDETGVWVSRASMKYIRREARRRGLPEQVVFDDWIARKQRQHAPQPASFEPTRKAPAGPSSVGRRIVALAFAAGWALVAYQVWRHGAASDRASMAVAFGAVGTIYFLPGLIAFARRRRRAGSILVTNLVLGWTGVGWVIALLWSLLGSGAGPRHAPPAPVHATAD